MDDGARVILRHLCNRSSNQRALSVVIESQPVLRLSRCDTSLATARDSLLSTATRCYDGTACWRTRAAPSTQPRLSPSPRRNALIPTVLLAYRSRASRTLAGAIKSVSLGRSRWSCGRGERWAGEEDYERPADRVAAAARVRVHRTCSRQAWLVSTGSPGKSEFWRRLVLTLPSTALDERQRRLKSCITASTFTFLSATLRTRCAHAVVPSPPCSTDLTEFGLVGRLPLGSSCLSQARRHTQEAAGHPDCGVAGPEHDGRRKRSRRRRS